MQPGMMPQGMPPEMQGMMGGQQMHQMPDGSTMPGPPMGGQGQMPMTPPQPGGMQYIQLVKQPDVMKYDIVVDESTHSRDSRERHFQALMQIMPMAMQAGIPVPKEVIDYAPLPETLRAKWKEKLQEAENAPKQPPLALQIEQMRGENMKAIEGMKQQAKAQQDQASAMMKQQQMQMDAQIKQQQIMMQAESERVVQAAQAESQRMVDQSKVQQDAMSSQIQMAQDRQKMLLDARLNAFETILNAMVDLETKNAETSGTEAVTGAQILPLLSDMMSSHRQDMTELMRVMSAPIEMTRDAATGTKRVRRLLQ
jgi:hypothetical protein